MIKAIFLDVDGTLVSFNTHSMPQSAVDALKQAHDAGIKIIIATGRPYTDLHEITEVPYDAVIALNGSDCTLNDGTRIFRVPISHEDFNQAIQLSKHLGFAIALETDKGILVNELTPTVIELVKLVDHPIPPVVDIEKEFNNSVCCQLCFFCNAETERQVMEQLPNLSASRWSQLFADINVAGINKATGISKIAEYYGINLSQTIAFGDGGNDIAMLRAAGIGVAMGNALDEVKSAADYITDEVDADGIRNALRYYGVI